MNIYFILGLHKPKRFSLIAYYLYSRIKFLMISLKSNCPKVLLAHLLPLPESHPDLSPGLSQMSLLMLLTYIIILTGFGIT